MNSFVKNPGFWAVAIEHTSTLVEKSTIDASLKHLYWFNLWFAAERDMDDIRNNVVKALILDAQKSKWLDTNRDCNTLESLKADITTEVENLLSDANILARANEFREYKRWVEERAQNCEFKEALGD